MTLFDPRRAICAGCCCRCCCYNRRSMIFVRFGPAAHKCASVSSRHRSASACLFLCSPSPSASRSVGRSFLPSFLPLRFRQKPPKKTPAPPGHLRATCQPAPPSTKKLVRATGLIYTLFFELSFFFREFFFQRGGFSPPSLVNGLGSYHRHLSFFLFADHVFSLW